MSDLHISWDQYHKKTEQLAASSTTTHSKKKIEKRFFKTVLKNMSGPALISPVGAQKTFKTRPKKAPPPPPSQFFRLRRACNVSKNTITIILLLNRFLLRRSKSGTALRKV